MYSNAKELMEMNGTKAIHLSLLGILLLALSLFVGWGGKSASAQAFKDSAGAYGETSPDLSGA